MGSLSKVIVAFAAVSVVLTLVLTSCYTTPRWTDGELKCSTNENKPCPAGAVCISGFCFEAPDLTGTGLLPDAHSIVDGSHDVDAGTD